MADTYTRDQNGNIIATVGGVTTTYAPSLNNPGYMNLLAQESAGTITIVRPAYITKAQCLLWLLSQGHTEQDILNAIATITDATAQAQALIEWKYRDPFARNNPLWDQLGPTLGMTPAQIDAAFIAASTL